MSVSVLVFTFIIYSDGGQRLSISKATTPDVEERGEKTWNTPLSLPLSPSLPPSLHLSLFRTTLSSTQYALSPFTFFYAACEKGNLIFYPIHFKFGF